jgi:hypothetical protein
MHAVSDDSGTVRLASSIITKGPSGRRSSSVAARDIMKLLKTKQESELLHKIQSLSAIGCFFQVKLVSEQDNFEIVNSIVHQILR